MSESTPSWVPDRAAWFRLGKVKGSNSIAIEFQRCAVDFEPTLDHVAYSDILPVHELASQLHNSDNHMLRESVLREMRDRPLSSRIDVIGQNGNDGLHYSDGARSKYDREVRKGVFADVYEVCGAFLGSITDPLFLRVRTAVDHAVKKLLAPGERGHKQLREDLVEARDSIDRAISQIDEWV